jgi:hypothetical protein
MPPPARRVATRAVSCVPTWLGRETLRTRRNSTESVGARCDWPYKRLSGAARSRKRRATPVIRVGGNGNRGSGMRGICLRAKRLSMGRTCNGESSDRQRHSGHTGLDQSRDHFWIPHFDGERLLPQKIYSALVNIVKAAGQVHTEVSVR